jgi:isocitrate dehydrogenase (NAD+)
VALGVGGSSPLTHPIFMKGKLRRVGFIPGDGIGPEVTWAARRCIESARTKITWERIPVGQEAFIGEGAPLASKAIKSLLQVNVALKGPVEGSYAGVSYNPNVMLKEMFGVYASIRRCRSYRGIGGGHEEMDLVVVKQEQHDWPRDFELDSAHPAWPMLLNPGWDESVAGAPTTHDRGLVGDSSSARGVAAVKYVCPGRARLFFEFAMKHAAEAGRKRVTIAHRANVRKKTDGLWLRTGEEVARRFGQLEFEDQLVDYVALQMARDPHRFDVIICPEEFGDVLGDLAAGFCGGLGMAPQAYFGVRGAIFTSVHGTAPKYAGLDRANPCAMILAGAELLGFIGENGERSRLEAGVAKAVAQGARTADLTREGEKALGTGAFAQAVIDAMGKSELRGAKAKIGP